MSSDSRVTVVRVGPVARHPNADTLSLTTVLGDGTTDSGYPVVIRTGEFSEGDLAVYVPVDVVVPATPAFAFLGPREKDRRVGAKRLRGVFSMGLLARVDAVAPGASEGDDVTESGGFAKWEPPEVPYRSRSGPGGKYLPGDTETGVSAHVAPEYTDIENVRRWASVLVEGEEVVATEKIHGANMRAVWSGGRLYVASRRRFLLPDSLGLWPDLARRYHLDRALREFPDVAVYGEAFGYVQDLRYGLGERTDLRLFDAMHTRSRRYLSYDEFLSLVAGMNGVLRAAAQSAGEAWPEIGVAPVLYRGPWQGLAAHRALAEGLTVVGGGACVREGFVVQPTAPRDHERLGRVILKCVGEGYHTRNRA